MGPRTRKFIGSLIILLFLFVYIVVAARVGLMVPNQPVLRFVYYLVAGTFWGVPLIPLLAWMNRRA